LNTELNMMEGIREVNMTILDRGSAVTDTGAGRLHWVFRDGNWTFDAVTGWRPVADSGNRGRESRASDAKPRPRRRPWRGSMAGCLLFSWTL